MMENYELLKKALSELAEYGQDEFYIKEYLIPSLDATNELSKDLISYCSDIENMAENLKTRRQYPKFEPYELENKINAVLKAYKQVGPHDDKPNDALTINTVKLT